MYKKLLQFKRIFFTDKIYVTQDKQAVYHHSLLKQL